MKVSVYCKKKKKKKILMLTKNELSEWQSDAVDHSNYIYVFLE